MNFEWLADRRDAIPLLGSWYHRAWGQRLRNQTESESIADLDRYLNVGTIPCILLATESSDILGAAQLKYHEMARLFPDREHWLGGVYVPSRHRGRGIASALVTEIIAQASALGVETLYLQTEQLDGGMYARLGWYPLELADNHGLKVQVMARSIAPWIGR